MQAHFWIFMAVASAQEPDLGEKPEIPDTDLRAPLVIQDVFSSLTPADLAQLRVDLAEAVPHAACLLRAERRQESVVGRLHAVMRFETDGTVSSITLEGDLASPTVRQCLRRRLDVIVVPPNPRRGPLLVPQTYIFGRGPPEALIESPTATSEPTEDDRLTLRAGETRLRSEELYENGVTITSYATRFDILGPASHAGEQVEVIFFGEYDTFAWREQGAVLCARVDTVAPEPCAGAAVGCTAFRWNAVHVLSELECPE